MSRNVPAVCLSLAILAPAVQAPAQTAKVEMAGAEIIDPAGDPALRQAYEAAFQAMLRDPADLDAAFRFAELAIRLEDYEGAVGALERLLLINPDLPRVNLELGVLYFRMGSFQMARTYLDRALTGADVPETVRERVQPFLDEIDRRTAGSTLTGSVFAGLRWQSNANAAPAGGLVRTPLGSATLDDQFTGKRDLNAFVAASVKHAFDLKTQTGDRYVTELTAYATRHREQGQLEVGLVDLRTGPQVALLPEALGNTTIRPFGRLAGVRLGDQPYFGSYGVGVELESAVSERFLLGASAQIAGRSYQNSAASPNARELTGRERDVELTAAYAVAPRSLLALTGTLTDEDTRTEGTANRQVRVEAAFSQEYDAPFGLTAHPWSTSLTVARVWADYDGPDASVDPGTTRADRDWRFGVLTSIGLAEDWALVVSGERAIEKSNLPNYQFNNWTGTVGINWTF